MALNFNDRLAVMRSAVMLQRLTAVVVNLANYLMNGTPTATQRVWALGALTSPEETARQVGLYILEDATFLANGSGIDDETLKGVGEAAIYARMIPA